MPEEPQCKEAIISNEYMDEIVGYYGRNSLLEEACYQIVNEDFAVVHRPRTERMEPQRRELSNFVPYCYGLQQENLEAIGVSRVRRISGLITVEVGFFWDL